MEKKSFATVADLAGVWKYPEDEEVAATVLTAASNLLRLIARNNGIDLDEKIEVEDDWLIRENIKNIICDAARRTLAAPSDIIPDASQYSMAASPYSQSISIGGGNAATIYFKTKELQLLGISSISGKSSIGILRGARG